MRTLFLRCPWLIVSGVNPNRRVVGERPSNVEE